MDCSKFSAWIEFSFNEPTKVAGYAIESRTDPDDGLNANCCHAYDSPRSWELLGSNDEGRTWRVLDAIPDETGWGKLENRRFAIPSFNIGSYRTYRLLISKTSGPRPEPWAGRGLCHVVISQLQFFRHMPPPASPPSSLRVLAGR